MSRAALRASEALWKRRHTYRNSRVKYWARKNNKAMVQKWSRLRAEASGMLDRRRAQIKKIDEKAGGPGRALDEARRFLGKTEYPAGSNTAPWGLASWIKACLGLNYGVAWCGVTVHHCLTKAGVKGLNGRCASVYFICEDAANSRYGWDKLVYRRHTGKGAVTAGRPGDAVGLYGESTHVAMIEKRVPGGYATLEGNTSPGNAGSQSNGGGMYRRIRPDSAVVYIARPDWS